MKWSIKTKKVARNSHLFPKCLGQHVYHCQMERLIIFIGMNSGYEEIYCHYIMLFPNITAKSHTL